jgi:hypothetical protein
MLDGIGDREPRTAAEIYEIATGTSNLGHDAVKRTPSDALRDMAMSADRIGGALLRLQSQWASASKPERRPVRSVKELQAIYGSKEEAQAAQRAENAEADASFRSALAALAERLPDLVMVRDELAPVALKWGMGLPPDPEERAERKQRQRADDERSELLKAEVEAETDEDDKMLAQATLNLHIVQMRRRQAQEQAQDRARARVKIGAVIGYWVQQRCPRCDGLKFLVLPGTARLSKNMCPPSTQGGCGGTGWLEVPHGQEGRRLANHMDSLAHRYKRSGGNRRQELSALPREMKRGKLQESDDCD